MKEKNNSSNGLLCATCKHIRTIRNDSYSSYHLSGILIDSFVYVAMDGWYFTDGEGNSSSQSKSYEQALLDYYNQISFNGIFAPSLSAPGSSMRNSHKYTKMYSGEEPVFTEADSLRLLFFCQTLQLLLSGRL